MQDQPNTTIAPLVLSENYRMNKDKNDYNCRLLEKCLTEYEKIFTESL